MLADFKDFVKRNKEKIILFAIVFLVSLFSFALGFIFAKISQKEPLEFYYESTSSPSYNY
jgi:hypothetical protein